MPSFIKTILENQKPLAIIEQNNSSGNSSYEVLSLLLGLADRRPKHIEHPVDCVGFGYINRLGQKISEAFAQRKAEVAGNKEAIERFIDVGEKIFAFKANLKSQMSGLCDNYSEYFFSKINTHCIQSRQELINNLVDFFFYFDRDGNSLNQITNIIQAEQSLVKLVGSTYFFGYSSLALFPVCVLASTCLISESLAVNDLFNLKRSFKFYKDTLLVVIFKKTFFGSLYDSNPARFVKSNIAVLISSGIASSMTALTLNGYFNRSQVHPMVRDVMRIINRAGLNFSGISRELSDAFVSTFKHFYRIPFQIFLEGLKTGIDRLNLPR